MDLCTDFNFLKTLNLIKFLLNVLKVAVPLVITVYASLDVYKMVIDVKAKAYKVVLNRLIAGFFVFFVPTFIDVVLNMMGEASISSTVCWANANSETIAVLEAKHKAEVAAKKQAEEARVAALEEQRKKNQETIQTQENIVNNSSTGGSSSFLSENGVDGKVEVINGVFYKPSTKTSGSDGTRGSAPYGYNKFFYARLERFIAAARDNGYTIIPSGDDYGSWRPFSVQQYYYNCYLTKSCNNGNLAAEPGSSNHGWGIASDLDFKNNKSAKYWAHDNARTYGLAFPLCENIRGKCSEDWHIEPISVVKR